MVLKGEINNIQYDISNLYSSNIISVVIIESKSLLTITLSESIDIYYSIDDNLLNIVLVGKKMGKKIREYSKVRKVVNIYYKDCVKYVINNINYLHASISKKFKKNLTFVKKLNNTLSLFCFNNQYLINIDDNGFLNYYPDTMEIYDIHNIDNFIRKEFSPKQLYFSSETNIENIIKSLNYNEINISIEKDPYILKDNIDISLNNNKLSIMDKLSFFAKKTDNNISNIKYYGMNASHILKLEDNKIKVLRQKKLYIPIYVENIEKDLQDNIILSGSLKNTKNYISIKYDKFLYNPVISIGSKHFV